MSEIISVGIIGAGPGGLGAARVLLSSSDRYRVDIFEASSNIGGIWNYDEHANNTSMYDVLETNLSRNLMSYQNYPLGDVSRGFMYPKRQEVQEYLESYFEHEIKGKGQGRLQLFLETPVSECCKEDEKWLVRAGTENTILRRYDYLIVANGHFSKPNVPHVAEQWSNERQLHSMHYKNSEQFRDKNVIVVGNGSSAVDITTQVAATARKTYQSVREDAKTSWPSDPQLVEVVPEIVKLDPATKTAYFMDGSHVSDVDWIIWATGYQYDMPFLPESYRADLFRGQTQRLHNLWEHMAYVPDPTLLFSLLLKNVVQFQLAELQGCVMHLIMSHIIPRAGITETEIPDLSSDSNYHTLTTPRDIQYYHRLQKIIEQYTEADPVHPKGFMPRLWNQDLIDERACSGTQKAERQKVLVRWAANQKLHKKPYSIPPKEFQS